MTIAERRKMIQAGQASVLEAVLKEVQRSEALSIVKAPPGSGKTELLVRAAKRLSADNARVAVAAQTNAQADDICTRLLAAKVANVIRLEGSTPGVVPPGVRVENRPANLPTGACVVVATARKWEYGDFWPFDVLFVDEAWQMTWSSFLGLDRVAGRFVLIGDPGQIPPVVTVDTAFWETTRRAPHFPAPDLLIREGLGSILTLPASWRLPADTASAVKSFYDFDFDCWAAPGDRVLRVSKRSKDVVDAAIDRLSLGSVVALTLPNPSGGSPPLVDDELAQTAIDLASRLMARGAETSIGDGPAPDIQPLAPADIGFCATHRVMNARMEELRPAGLSASRVDTAERWQGLQRKVMVVIHPLSGVEEPSGFDLDTGRLCVMASRHRVGLVVLAREDVTSTLDGLIVGADQAIGRPDANGRGHAQHAAFWDGIVRSGQLVAA